MDFRIFKPTYTDRKSKAQRQSDTYHVAFRDHLNRRQSIAAGRREREASAVAEKIKELIEHRKNGEAPKDRLQKWFESLPEKMRRRLVEMELVEQKSIDIGMPLLFHLDGEKSDEGVIVTPGFRQSLESKGGTADHARVKTDRVRLILNGCGFVYWKDLIKPGAATRVAVWLGSLRESGKIGGQTLNYYIRDFRSFCRWMETDNRASRMAMESLKSVPNAEVDTDQRRAISVDEMRLLVQAAASGGELQGLSGDQRALLYRFAFETGIRPGQIRTLTVGDFNLNTEPATVTTHARHVKRRKTHIQAIRPSLAAELKKRFANKLPAAPALAMPSKYHMADMLRHDLAAARAEWISKAVTDKDREERQRSDFLAAVNHEGQRAVFYSTRHGHGTALADAGVPEKDIAASMHHATRKTTARYLHSGREAVARAIDAMPDLSYPPAQVATGTNGPEQATADESLRNACATVSIGVESGGGIDGKQNPDLSEKTPNQAENETRPLGGIGRRDGFKIHFPKGVSVRLR